MVFLHQALAGGLEVSSVLTIQISTETTSAPMDKLWGNDLNADSICDDL